MHRASIARHRAALLALTLLVSTGLPAPPAHSFDLQKHSIMTKQVLGRHGLTGAALALVAYGALLPDVQDCIPHCYCDFAPGFCQPDSSQAPQYGANHFDNNLLDESIFRVNLRMGEAQAGISSATGNPRASALALMAFGKAVHTTQDFYAHSTFVEINLFPGPFITTNINDLPIWQGEPYALYTWHNPNASGGGDLQTGYYLAGPPAGGYTHGQLNKDNPGSPEGRQTARVSGVAATTLYGVASGDVTGGGTYTDLGLAPRHTIYAYSALLSGGLVFPYVFLAEAPRPPADPMHAQRVLDFFSYVNSDPTLIAMAQAADSIVAHSRADSIGGFPISAIDSEGVPLPLPVSVPTAELSANRLLSPARPNPFRTGTELGFSAPRIGNVRLDVFDLEGRRVVTLFRGEAATGPHRVRWDGRGDSGARVAAGVYLVRFTGFGRVESGRVALLQ